MLIPKISVTLCAKCNKPCDKVEVMTEKLTGITFIFARCHGEKDSGTVVLGTNQMILKPFA